MKKVITKTIKAGKLTAAEADDIAGEKFWEFFEEQSYEHAWRTMVDNIIDQGLEEAEPFDRKLNATEIRAIQKTMNEAVARLESRIHAAAWPMAKKKKRKRRKTIPEMIAEVERLQAKMGKAAVAGRK